MLTCKGADQAQVLGKYAKLEAGDPERQNRLVVSFGLMPL